jgi:hypothetical protein
MAQFSQRFDLFHEGAGRDALGVLPSPDRHDANSTKIRANAQINSRGGSNAAIMLQGEGVSEQKEMGQRT